MISFTEPVFYQPGDRVLTHMAANRDGCFAVLKAKDESGKVVWRAVKEVRVDRLKVPPSASYDEYAKTFIERAEETWGMPFVPWLEDGDLVPTVELSTLAMLEDKHIPERPLTHHDVLTYLIGNPGGPGINAPAEAVENIARGWLEGRRIHWVQQGRAHAVRYIVDQAFQTYGRKEPAKSEIEQFVRNRERAAPHPTMQELLIQAYKDQKNREMMEMAGVHNPYAQLAGSHPGGLCDLGVVPAWPPSILSGLNVPLNVPAKGL